MTETYTLTQAKAKLSELINKIIYQKDTIVITRKGRPVAAIVSIDKLDSGPEKGLFAARNVLSEIDEEIDAMVDTINETRDNEVSRKVSL
ncbi:type II toxin-antitoxin system Phd/YefM family antitoxin [candidate division CSSED10-310 bacterium]|uniref:Antitoxin n=1 Tax=candidate division CSSED10-310 bacterium TaxID=2855610 RepID=A0ABV6YRE9_UNCC1